MNKIITLLTLSFLASFVTVAQEQKHRISFITELDPEYYIQHREWGFWGVSYDYQFKPKQNLGAYFALQSNDQLLGIDYQYDFNLIRNNLKFNLGAGTGLHFYQMIGLDGKEMFLTGIGGFTYNFSTNPVSIFANYRPKVEFPTFDVLSSSDIRIGISYRF